MSTLNGIVLATVAIVLFSSLTADREPGRRIRRQVASHLNTLHYDIVTDVALGRAINLTSLAEQTTKMKGMVSGGGQAGRAVHAAVDAYRDTAIEIGATATSTVVEGDSFGHAPANPRVIALDRLQSALARVSGAIAEMPDFVAPDWVHGAIPYFPWALAWVIFLTLVTLYEAFRLRSRLSVPLEKVTEAAVAVSEGRLHTPMPQIDGADEIRMLAESVSVMRDRLLKSIHDIDKRNTEMSTILAHLEDGVLHVSPDGSIRERNKRASQLVLDLAGVAPGEGDNVRSFFTELPETWLSSTEDTQRELKFGRGANEHYLLVKTTPVGGTGAPEEERGFVVVLRDVTQSKEVDKLKRDFLSVVTHELKTPLTAIEGYTKLLLMGKGGTLSEKQATFLGTIRTQTGKLKEMIQDLLDITRLEARRLPLSLTELSLGEVISEAHEAHSGDAQSRGLSCELETSAVDAARFVADPFRIQQVLGNLLGNAFKFTPHGGKITLIGGEQDDRVFISISDTGRGIPADALPRLFDKFYQVQRGDTRLSGGAGLGLYICRELVEAQGGTIEVTSTEDVGSIFTISFPKSGHGKERTTIDAMDGLTTGDI